MKNLILIPATKESNGVTASQDIFNPCMYNLQKVSANGRKNGLIGRFNTATGNLIFDGTSHRAYVNSSLLELAVKNIEKLLN